MFRRSTVLVLVALLVVGVTTMFATTTVTFKVKMGVQIQMSKYNPANNDTVVVRGDFQVAGGDASNWGGYKFLMTYSATDSSCSITVPFNDTMQTKGMQFKYVLHPKNGSDTWESINNRTYTLTTALSQAVPVDWFNSQATSSVTHKVLFQADLTTLIAAGFNAATDSIVVNGDFNGWGSSYKATPALGNTKLYQYLVPTLSAALNATVNYKWKAFPDAKFDNTGWETGNNRTYTMADKDTNLAAVVPAITVKNVITANDTVTFVVNMNGAKDYHNKLAITGLTGVYIAGGTGGKPLAWPSAWTYADTAANGALIKMNSIGGGVYSVTLIFKQSDFTSVNLEYKYGAVYTKVDTVHGGVTYLDNEAGYAQNHKLVMTPPKQTVNDVFGSQATGVVEISAPVPETYALSQNYPNPFNPSTNVRYSLPIAGNVSLKLYNLLGQEVATMFEGYQNAGTYVASFNANRLSSGVYFYRLVSGRFADVKKMILMK